MFSNFVRASVSNDTISRTERPLFFLKSSRKIRSHTDVLGLRNPPPLAEEKRARDRTLRMSAWEAKARFRRHSTHVPNLTDELSTAKERLLNQFGTAKALSSTESVELLSNLT